MTHHDTHPGSLPEDRFDSWLDAFVSGTPGDAASLNGTDGSLGRAMSGARQLHGLAADTTPTAAAQRRIEEDLMRSGTLAALRGMTWIPIEKDSRRASWWSPTSPVIAAALVVALIVALGASFIATQRPAEAPTPGFALASPEAQQTQNSQLLIVDGEPSDELRKHYGRIGAIDDAGLTVTRPGEDDLVFPGVTGVMPNGVPGEAVLNRDDGTRSVIDLTTGETRFDLPPAFGSETQVGTYLFIPESDENTDWTIYDLRTGDSRSLSEIVDLPADQPVMPVSFGQVSTQSATVFMHFVTPELETAATSDIPSFVIAGSLDRATTLDGYPPASQARESLPVTSPDGATVAWVATEPENAIVVADTATGDELARFDLGAVSPYAVPAGFTADGERLVVLAIDRVLLLGWAKGEPEQTVIAEGMTGALSPVFYAPASTLYYYQGDALQRMTVPDADVRTVLDGFASSSLPMYAAPGSPWIFASLGTDIALIDARTGEIVSHLRDMPANEAEFGALSISTSRDGATVIQTIGGSESGYLVSPEYPDGLVLTAPIDPEIIAASDSPDGIPVHYTLSPDGGSVVASTSGESGSIPHFVAEIGPDPEWVPMSDDVETLYWLPMPAIEDDESDARTLPAQDFASPMATPAARAACNVTIPNGSTPPGEEPSASHHGTNGLWTVLWPDSEVAFAPGDPGTIAPDGTLVMKWPWWRGPDVQTPLTIEGQRLDRPAPPLQADVPEGYGTYGFQATVLRFPTPGCWEVTASVEGRSLTFVTLVTWNPDAANAGTGPSLASPAASPVAASVRNPVMVVEGTAGEARIENGVAIATLGDDGLTLPVGGEMVTIPDVVQVRTIWGHRDTLHVIREDGTEAVIDLATGNVRFELPGFENWARGSGRWQLVPSDDGLTDWTIIDMTTGETRLLSELVGLSSDTAVLPREVPSIDPDAPSVFEVEPVTIDGTRLNPSGPPVAIFVIAGSLDRTAPLPDYPTTRDNVGEPTLVSSADGGMVAYEIRAGDDRIVILDTATGEELGRYGVDAVGENPTLAGFSGDSRDLIVTTDDGRVMQLAPDGGQALVLHDGLEGIDNPLLFRDGSLLYVRQVDTLLRIEMLPDGAVTEVATGLVPGAFDFTMPRGNWIVAQTRDGHIMVDARTGEVVSQMKAPANRSRIAEDQFGAAWFDVDDDGDTVIFAIATTLMPLGPNETPSAAWLLSPDFPDGMEVAAPENAGTYWLSPDGRTLFAYTSERSSGPGTIWRTPLGVTPDWQPIAENVTPLPNPMMYLPEG